MSTDKYIYLLLIKCESQFEKNHLEINSWLKEKCLCIFNRIPKSESLLALFIFS